MGIFRGIRRNNLIILCVVSSIQPHTISCKLVFVPDIRKEVSIHLYFYVRIWILDQLILLIYSGYSFIYLKIKPLYVLLLELDKTVNLPT